MANTEYMLLTWTLHTPLLLIPSICQCLLNFKQHQMSPKQLFWVKPPNFSHTSRRERRGTALPAVLLCSPGASVPRYSGGLIPVGRLAISWAFGSSAGVETLDTQQLVTHTHTHTSVSPTARRIASWSWSISNTHTHTVCKKKRMWIYSSICLDSMISHD